MNNFKLSCRIAQDIAIQRTAQSLFKIIQSMSEKDREKFFLRINGEITPTKSLISQEVLLAKNFLSGLNPIFIKLVLTELTKMFIKNSFNKIAQQPYIPTTDVIIEPIDPLVQQAVNKIKQTDPNFFLHVEKIIVHFGGGAGNLGYVKRGLNDNPRIIHIYKDRIKEIIQKQFNGDMNASNFEQAVQLAIAEVIAHEKTHIGEKPEEFFHDELEAERSGIEVAKKLKPQFADDLSNAILVLNDVREKYLPSIAMAEPNLSFLIYCRYDDKYNITKEGIHLLCSSNTYPIIKELEDICEFNNDKIMLVAKNFGHIEKIADLSLNSIDFALGLAKFQYNIGLKPTGKINSRILKKFANIKFKNFPRNFGIVVPNKLYRGGIIEHPFQARALRDQCGVKRIISLHEDPEIVRICNFIGIEHVPAYLKWGESHELGRQVFGDSISNFLMEKPTYIHCFYGEDRTGGVIARFRTENGWPCRLAYLEAKAYGFKDVFVPLIEWFTEPTNELPPIDLDKMKIKFKELIANNKDYIYDKTSGNSTYTKPLVKGLFANRYFDKNDIILDKYDFLESINYSNDPNAILEQDNDKSILKALTFIPRNKEITISIEQDLIESGLVNYEDITPFSITPPLSIGSLNELIEK